MDDCISGQHTPTDAAVDAVPHVVVAHCAPGGRAPLGLGRALPLLGGGARLAPCGLPSDCGMDHLPHFRSIVADACRLQWLRSANWFWQKPTALVGPDGTGRGLAARWLAFATGLPLFRFDPRSLAGSHRHDVWPSELLVPPLPAIAIAASACANPIILLEIDEEPIEAVDELLAKMVDRQLTARWLDETTGAVLDMSHVTWIVQAERLPPALGSAIDDVGAVLEVGRPSGVAASLRSLAITGEVCRDSGLDAVRSAAVFAAVDEASKAAGVRTGPVSCAALCELAAREARSLRGAGA